MEDKRQALGFILIILVVMTYTQFAFSPQPAPQPVPQGQGNQTSPQAPQTVISQGGQQPAAQSSPYSASPNSASQIPTASPEALAAAPRTIVSNGAFSVTFNHLGARVEHLQFSEIKKTVDKSDLLDIISNTEGGALPGGIWVGEESDTTVNYTLKENSGFRKEETGTLRLSGESTNSATLVFEGNLPSGTRLTKTYRFSPWSYLFTLEATSSVTAPGNTPLLMSWPISLKDEDLNQRYDPYFFSLYATNDKVSHIDPLSQIEELKETQSANWLAFGDRYFTLAIIPAVKEESVLVRGKPTDFAIFARGEPTKVSATIFAGPKRYDLLKSTELKLERTIDMGFFSFIAYPLLRLLSFFYSIFGNYGVAIVALTLLVKTVFYPLNKASLKSMKGIQELGPEMEELKKRVKDPTQLNQEMLALYKRKGVNPMGGCFPVLIQIPVFFGLYSSLQNAVELRHAPFALWIHDLASPEQLRFLGINFPVLILTMGALMFYQQYRTPTPNMDPAQRKMMLGMSLVFTLMFLLGGFPAGLALYMLVNTTISLVQQQALRSEDLNRPFQVTLLASAGILLASVVLAQAGTF